MKSTFAAALMTVTAGAGMAVADMRPPADAQPLSAILASVEAAHDVAWIDEVEWEDDRGEWEVEVRLASGGQLTLRIDPVTGETR